LTGQASKQQERCMQNEQTRNRKRVGDFSVLRHAERSRVPGRLQLVEAAQGHTPNEYDVSERADSVSVRTRVC